MKKYDFSEPPNDYERRMDAMGKEFVEQAMLSGANALLAAGGDFSLHLLAGTFTAGFLYGQEHPLEKPKKKKIPTQS